MGLYQSSRNPTRILSTNLSPTCPVLNKNQKQLYLQIVSSKKIMCINIIEKFSMQKYT